MKQEDTLSIGYAFQPGNCLTIEDVPYRVIRPIGKGAIGDVYEVENLFTHKKFAMKHLYFSYATDPRKYYGKLRFLVASGSPHPCFVWPIALTKYDDQTNSFCCIMPLVGKEFQPLARAINNRKLMTMEQRLSVCRQLAEAFSRLQAWKWVYGDCSAKNILFKLKRGSDPEVRIIDCDTVTTEKASFGLEGSGCYRAPEILLGGCPTRNSDAHALASVLFHLLIGCNPLDGTKTRSEPFTEDAVLRHFGRDPVYIFNPAGQNKPLSSVLTTRLHQLPLALRVYFQVIFSEDKLKNRSPRPGADILLQYLTKP